MKLIYSVLVFLFLVSCGAQEKNPDLKWILPASEFERQDFSVSIILPDEIQPGEKIPLLEEVVDGNSIRIACQISVGEQNKLSWVVPGITKAGQERKFELRFKKGKVEVPAISVEENDSTLLITKGEQAILHYRYSEMPAPSGKSELFARSGFIHPLYSPSGEMLTWAQPPDHIHHVGLWNPWTKVTWKGNHTDFWNLGTGLGTVRFKDVISTESGAVFAEFQVLQDHIAFVPPKPVKEGEEDMSKEVIVIEEEWIIRVWNVDDGYLLDFTSLIRNVLDESISLDAYRYGGGLGYRATSKWNKNNSTVLTSEGKTRIDGDATRASWCWISGDLEGTYTGLLFMSDVNNYDYPQPMRIWPDNSNGVGHQYFEFTPIREKAWILEPGETYSQKYRIWVKEGRLTKEKAEQQWQQYIEAMDQNISYLTNEF